MLLGLFSFWRAGRTDRTARRAANRRSHGFYSKHCSAKARLTSVVTRQDHTGTMEINAALDLSPLSQLSPKGCEGNAVQCHGCSDVGIVVAVVAPLHDDCV